MDDFERRRANRLALITAVYQATGGNIMRFIDLKDVLESAQLSPNDAVMAADYLKGEGLLSLESNQQPGLARLTHLGVREVEQAKAAPAQATDHLPAPATVSNVVVIERMYGGSQIQQGTTGSYQEQHVEMLGGDEIARLRELVSEYRRLLNEHEADERVQGEAETQLGTIESQLSSAQPNRTIVTLSLGTLWELAQRVAGGVITQALMEHFQLFGVGT